MSGKSKEAISSFFFFFPPNQQPCFALIQQRPYIFYICDIYWAQRHSQETFRSVSSNTCASETSTWERSPPLWGSDKAHRGRRFLNAIICFRVRLGTVSFPTICSCNPTNQVRLLGGEGGRWCGWLWQGRGLWKMNVQQQ